MPIIALTELLGSPVYDVSGARSGRVKEVAVTPEDDSSRVAFIIVRTRSGKKVIPHAEFRAVELGLVRVSSRSTDWQPLGATEGHLLLDRDLLDQQIIDVHGRKVVRVNDVDFDYAYAPGPILRVLTVDVGPRGAVRRLLQGLVPASAVSALVDSLPVRALPWDVVNLIETDPARRVKLKLSSDRLASLHPADIAEILEELAPAQREAVFETLDEEVAADTLEELDPKVQVEMIESMESERAADLVEEMDPDAAADLLGELSEERSEEILEEMEPDEREEMEELLEFEEDTAAGRMTTEYLSVLPGATVNDAIEALRNYEGGVETVSTIFLVEPDGKLAGAVPLATMVLAPANTSLATLSAAPLVSCRVETPEQEAVELFDKYNLAVLPVVDSLGRISGVITADDIISLLREKE